MEENTNREETMADFEKELQASFRKIREGEQVKGEVISVTDQELLVNIGYVADGIIPKEETLLKAEDVLADNYKPGDQVTAEVLSKNDGDGNVLLSIKKAVSFLVWEELESAFERKGDISVTVKSAVKGGVVCDIQGVRGFIPASQLSVGYVENLEDYVGVTFDVRVIELDEATDKVILSRKVVEEEERAEARGKLMDTIQKGDRFTGKVKKVLDFGAFVDLGGVDGLVHIGELSWTKIKHPSEVVKEGETVDVVVLDVDKKRGRISLGYKALQQDPWAASAEAMKVGSVQAGTVTRIADFGAFVQIADGVEGLVHISEISDDRVNKVEDVLSVGQQVKVKVLEKDLAKKKIRLSMKGAEASENRADLDAYIGQQEEATTNLESVFKKFLKDLE
ncbi:30S ribosomal protein S1 [Anaerotalea alkaliphila]|uniref:30S ribosomal protein S1 n=1 Tax=Anaerotalea alkaliphila TaxID=2662126 RepID=A0A7X5KP68_9FIRM|nr:30S ribosomal protein S1 [Anaerotalea alkaliphila]NDL67622.1 30S ribosomal protein S1 [Anaerotalea alkaliphila]